MATTTALMVHVCGCCQSALHAHIFSSVIAVTTSILQMGPSSPLVTCHRYETLHRCLELFAATQGRCERLVCVDEHNRCTGVVSLSDIFAYLANEGPIAMRASAGSFHHAEPPNPAPAVGLQLQG